MSYETNDKVVFKYKGAYEVGVVTGRGSDKDNKTSYYIRSEKGSGYSLVPVDKKRRKNQPDYPVIDSVMTAAWNKALEKGDVTDTNLFAKDELVKVKTVKRTAVETRGRKSLSKKQKVLNLLSKGDNVAWSTIQNRFELESPRSMIDTLRAEGYMIYGSKVKGKHVYRMGTPTRAIISAGIQALYGTPFKYDNSSARAPRKGTVASIDA